jgi:UDP-N-acetylmuramate--alanine ligase
MNQEPSTFKKVHCIGLGGIGVSAMAKLLRARGVNVTGSDKVETQILKDLKSRGIKYWIGSRPEKLGTDVDLVIYSSAVPVDDEERIRARHLGIREVTYNDFLGEVSRGTNLVAITGTHGKSSTTAMLGHILIEAGVDPTVVVGSKVNTFKAGNLHLGESDVFVAEGCEHEAHMLALDPKVIILTNVEHDHPDFYRDVDHVRETMREFVEKLPEDGLLIWNTNDEQSRKLIDELKVQPRLIGVGDQGVLYARVEQGTGEQIVHVQYDGAHVGDVHFKLPGEYNVTNALMASAAASHFGVKPDKIKRALESFPGLWRRFERLGKFQGAETYSDYAHHPTAVARLLEGVKTFFAGKRIVLCFQPHQHARTMGLFDDFVQSMDDADVVIITEIYGVAGRKEGEETISSADLVEALNRDTAFFATNDDEMLTLLQAHVKKDDVLLMVGAGSIDAFARTILNL